MSWARRAILTLEIEHMEKVVAELHDKVEEKGIDSLSDDEKARLEGFT